METTHLAGASTSAQQDPEGPGPHSHAGLVAGLIVLVMGVLLFALFLGSSLAVGAGGGCGGG